MAQTNAPFKDANNAGVVVPIIFPFNLPVSPRKTRGILDGGSGLLITQSSSCCNCKALCQMWSSLAQTNMASGTGYGAVVFFSSP